ncbi:MAG: SUMF1/EgtB/PvdO family nonheme iron enzyme [Candidatus Zhuqueibacterota bacterium]
MYYANILKWASIAGSNRVMRGGSWNNTADNCRSANRNRNNPERRNNNVGFRLVFVPQLTGKLDDYL